MLIKDCMIVREFRFPRLSEAGAQAICEAPKSGITFDRESFAADPRIARLKWKR